MKILQLVSVMLFALVTGVFWGTWFSLSRSMDAITAATFLEIGRIMISNLGRPMSILLPASILSAVPIIYVLYRRRESSGFVLVTLAVSLMLAAMTITLLVNVPLDHRFVEWTIATLPPDWRDSARSLGVLPRDPDAAVGGRPFLPRWQRPGESRPRPTRDCALR